MKGHLHFLKGNQCSQMFLSQTQHGVAEAQDWTWGSVSLVAYFTDEETDQNGPPKFQDKALEPGLLIAIVGF